MAVSTSNTNQSRLAPVPAVAPIMVGEGTAMSRLKSTIAAVASRDCTVLIRGESGSGKEIAARTIHAQSKRASGPFVAVDCTGLRDTLLESQLFGHVKGAFTGADQAAIGFIRAADGGTLFLDEIGEMELKTQAKFLRVMQERCVVPLGSVKPVPVDVRVVCATHRNLRELAVKGEFREDLLFRLDVVQMSLPPLRQRIEDILPLATHFLKQLSELYGENARTISPAAGDVLERYSWPGNVRELANAVEHAVVFSQHEVIQAEDLPERVRGVMASASAPVAEVTHPSVGESTIMTLEAMEKDLIARALKATGGNQSAAAGLLKIERRRLYRKIATYGLRGLTGAGE